MSASGWVLAIAAFLVADLLLALALGRRLRRLRRELERAIDPVFIGVDVAPDGSCAMGVARQDDAGHLWVESIAIEGTPLAQQEFSLRVGNDLGRGVKVRAAAAEERRRLGVLDEMRAEHEALSAPPSSVSGSFECEADEAAIAWVRDQIDRVLPDPSVPKGER